MAKHRVAFAVDEAAEHLHLPDDPTTRGLGAVLGMDLDPDQRYPDRLVGTMGNGDRVSILIRYVGADNAGRYRRWVTMRSADFDSMTNRPQGWRYYLLMVGLLPDGQPWWMALYDESHLRQPDVYQHAELMNPSYGGRFYRFDPHLVAPALVAENDFTKKDDRGMAPALVAVIYRCPGCGLLADLEPTDEATKECPVCHTDEPMHIFERTYPALAKAG